MGILVRGKQIQIPFTLMSGSQVLLAISESGSYIPNIVSGSVFHGEVVGYLPTASYLVDSGSFDNRINNLSGSFGSYYTQTQINNFFSGSAAIAGYNKAQWDSAYTNRITNLTVSGSSGSAALSGNTLNVPTYTLSGLGGQPSGSYVDISKYIVRERPSGFINGSNNTFALAATPAASKEMIFINGILMDEGGLNDYTLMGNIITFTAGATPGIGDKILVTYITL